MDSLPLNPGEVVADRYRVGEVIAVGGFAVVYEAERLDDGQVVALKALRKRALDKDESALKRIEREAKVAETLENPHSVRVLDYGETSDGHFFYAMERLIGQSLEWAIRHGEQFTPAHVKTVLVQVLAALAELHAKGLVHRDVKPANIFMCQREDGAHFAKVLDYGFAKLLDIAPAMDGEEEEAPLTRIGMVLGTPGYLAPEVCEGKAITPQADLYAVGIISYEMLTGAPAYYGKASEKVRQQMQANPPAMEPELRGLAISAVIEKLMERKPSRRYTSALLAIEALEAIEDPAAERKLNARWWQFW